VGRFDDHDEEYAKATVAGGRASALALQAENERARRLRSQRLAMNESGGPGPLLWVEVEAATDRGLQLAAYFHPATQRIGWVPRSAVEHVRGVGDATDERGFPVAVEQYDPGEVGVGYKGLVRLAPWKVRDLGWGDLRPKMPREDDR